MKKTRPEAIQPIHYRSEAEPKGLTPDGIPVFCAHDEIIPIEKATPNPKNPNTHDAQQIELLGNIIRANGWRAPVTISRRSGLIVKGHGRRLAAMFIKSGYVPVDYQDYASDAEEWADLIADNRLAELSTIDSGKLVSLIGDLDTGEIPIELTGYTEEDIASIIAALEGADDTVDDGVDSVPEIEDAPASRPGDLWLLGSHRVLCGSATHPADVARLLDGELGQLVNTDPPYGVSYKTQSGKFDVIANDDLTHDDLLKELLLPAFRHYATYTDPDAAFYIWHASSSRRDFEDAMTAAGLIEKQYIIWVKNAPVLGHADYQWAHEPCLYAEKAGQHAQWHGDRSQRTTWKAVLRAKDGMATVLTGGVVLTDGAGGKVYLSDKPPKGKKIRYIRLSEGRSVCLYPESKATTVWEVARETGTEHPTQKPVELAVRAIDNSTEVGDLVLDFFGGSGSTLIGAQLTGRRCFTMELDPKYVDVIVKRYVQMTGNMGVTCVRDGEEIPFMQIMNTAPKMSGGGVDS